MKQSQDQKPLVVCIFGPTASGKTDIAVALRKRLPVELVSVDSALVFRGMDIGTAKPDAETLKKAPHRLIDICDPSAAYSAARFREDAISEIEAIHRVGKIPLLVGGTMLYFKALLEGLSPLPPADQSIRDRLEKEAKEVGWQALHDRLKEVDPDAADRIHPNDPQRLQRALEVYELTGSSLTELQKQAEPPLANRFRILRVALMPKNRAHLHERIEQRYKLMLQQGLLEEVQRLKSRGDLSLDLPSMRCVGYRQVWQFLDGEFNESEMLSKAVAATRQLAKRQLTWLRSTESELEFDPFESSFDVMVEGVSSEIASYLENPTN